MATGKKEQPEPSPYNVEVGRRVEKAIRMACMKHSEVVRAASQYDKTLYDSTLSNITKGKRRASASQLAAIARVLGCSLDDLTPRDFPGESGSVPAAGEPAAPAAEPPLPMLPPVTDVVHYVGKAIADYFERHQRATTDEERELIMGWFKAKPPPVIDDEIIEDLLRAWRRHNERIAGRVATWRERRGPGPDDGPEGAGG